MTGYGLGSYSDKDVELRVETKSLNSKFADVNVRLPRIFLEKELEIRNIITNTLQRGKINVNIDFQLLSKAEALQQYNEPLFKQYYKQLKSLADSVNASDADIFKMALSAPDVVVNKTETGISDEIWDLLIKVINESLKNCDHFRRDEGKSIERQFINSIDQIEKSLEEIKQVDPQRVNKIKNRLRTNLSEVVEEEQMDKNRLEQEIIFYIEKLDISEEKSRLSNHLEYFKQTLKQKESQGKKLNFIAQEIGREINTIGSKANDAEIQQKVVVMKDELEKIKEQVLNVL